MNEYINKNKLIEFANNHINKTIDSNDIARFPIADVIEGRCGKWIEDEYFGDEIVCSNCGTPAIIDANIQIVKSFYCPFCGAKMDRGE